MLKWTINVAVVLVSVGVGFLCGLLVRPPAKAPDYTQPPWVVMDPDRNPTLDRNNLVMMQLYAALMAGNAKCAYATGSKAEGDYWVLKSTLALKQILRLQPDSEFVREAVADNQDLFNPDRFKP